MSDERTAVKVTVNGALVVLEGAPDVTALLTHLGLPDCGVAVAIDGMVRPQSRWSELVPADSVVDIVTAVQGG
ncbi:MAG: sulfur carrier protein ThiS [Gordonia sp. (in: high G+C Gram-positive bacteria)]|uniref:sulfur carrier protein ThiS n=1 Tax=Gordonia sp. (in: high G+C Gram-positive bacteria) TaxID=84139 RepID=UPI003BB75F75